MQENEWVIKLNKQNKRDEWGRDTENKSKKTQERFTRIRQIVL